MRAYVDLPRPLSRAMDRVIAALKATAGRNGVTVTLARDHADVVILHVIGYDDTVEAINELTQRGQRYAMVQYCVRSTQRPHTADWLPLWRGAMAVWSYYDLEAMHAEDAKAAATEDNVVQFQTLAELGVNFYLAPLGADANTFRPYNVPRRAEVMTSGYVAESESVLEVARAVQRVNGRMLHLGPELDGLDGTQVAYLRNVPDGILAQSYSRCRFVSGLRRCEGFELPAVEGLLCGARPIMYDRPHYRLWFDGLAEFIPEGSPSEVEEAIVALFHAGPRPVTDEEREQAAKRFDWSVATEGFWLTLMQRSEHARPTARSSNAVAGVPRGTSPRRMLLVADAVVSSGFARSARAYVDGAIAAGWDVHVLGLNYHGDPHDWPCKIYPCAPGGDMWGLGRLPELVGKIAPSVVVVQNDPWNLPRYMKAIGTGVPTVAVLAVDGKNMAQAIKLNGLAGAIFWTQFGEQEARKGGYVGPAAVVPLGVDLDIYKPQDRAEMRRLLLPPRAHESFIVGCANRNQPRKRMDLLISYFAQWVREFKRHDAMLYLHVAPTGDKGYDLRQLMAYHGINDRLILQEPEVGYGLSERSLAAQYATWDVGMTATQGEGWGLTTMEGMACGIPQIVPRWSALAEWPGDAVASVPCSEIAVTPGYVNVIGAIMDREDAIAALDLLYTDSDHRHALGARGLAHVYQPHYRWKAIGDAFVVAVDSFLDRKHY